MTRLVRILILFAAFVVPLAIWSLEDADHGLVTRDLQIGDTPATLMQPEGPGPHPLAVIAHGYAGSRQMMRSLQITLARGGMAAVTFDFHGHGRHPLPLSPDVGRVEGTTADLVDQTVAVTREMLTQESVSAPVLLAGHSMATDVVIRAARETETGAVVAVSMYSDAVTATHPARLLMVSGQWEDGLREVALDRLRMVAPGTDEGGIAVSDEALRRAVFAPMVGHAGVLWSPTLLREAQSWAVGAGLAESTSIPRRGPWIAGLLVALVVLGRAGIGRLAAAPVQARGTIRRDWLAVAAPILPALAVGAVWPLTPLGLLGFGKLSAMLAVWGAVQIALVRPAIGRPGPATLVLGGASLVFALALDRYGAAFLPVGARQMLMWQLALGGCLTAVAQAALPRWPRYVSRAALLVTLGGAMALDPTGFGLMFTILPVTLLFWAVFATMARPAVRADGAVGPGVVLGLTYAWSLAASTPLFAVAS